MENRIKINGVWYVKEKFSLTPDATEYNIFDEKDVVFTENCQYQTENYIWEAFIIKDEDEKKQLSIKFTDKTKKNWSKIEEELWNSTFWFMGINENDQDSLREARLYMDDEGIEMFQKFLNYLICIDWLK